MNSPEKISFYYQSHVFFCLNQRADSTGPSCAKCGAETAFAHAQARIKTLNLGGAGKIRINRAGCLGRCKAGPVLVIYPQGLWYRYESLEDIDAIIETQIVRGKILTRLLCPEITMAR